MGKPKEGGVSATWDANEVLIYCELCVKEVELGNRPTTHFNKVGWNNLVANFQARTGRQYDRGQMKNKWDMLKKEWKLWKDLKGKETGLGWNTSRRTIDASDEWWDERLKIVPAAKKFRYTGISPELEEKLDMMFSEVAATGESSNQSYSIAEVVKELNKHEDIIGDNFLYDFATVFMLQKTNREMFICLDEDKRVWWLKNRYRCMSQQLGP
ncbi:hypothetical protein KSP39_PZI014241 [Platanthera zijinensis]|uniref:Myb/SANT-like domain-containing protein n=1 Tax=Platanthera zijinensis TaxID=2320716 RepID=A0AAP0BAA1_9ASPA